MHCGTSDFGARDFFVWIHAGFRMGMSCGTRACDVAVFESATYRTGNGPTVERIVKCSMYFALPVLALAASSWAQSADPSTSVRVDDERHIKIVRTDNPPTLDGVLDDPCWAEAGKTSAFFNERSFTLCTEQTIVYMTYDPENCDHQLNGPGPSVAHTDVNRASPSSV